MELSYAAYNYPQGGDLPDIPGNFMGDVTEPVTQIFTDLGFTNCQDYNYDESNNVAHVIAHRNIEFTQGNEGVLNDVYGYDIGYSGIGDAVVYTVTDGTGGSEPHSSPGALAGEPSDFQISTDGTGDVRPLVVVSVRGSVSIHDWIMSFCTQFHMCLFDFEIGRDMMMKPKLPRLNLKVWDLMQLHIIMMVDIRVMLLM